MEDKLARFSAIKKIIRLNKITCQEQLLEHLHENGFGVTQATLSRDLKQLNVVKVSDGIGGYYYTLLESEAAPVSAQALLRDFERGFLSLQFSGNLGLIKTLPGHASSIAYALDNLKIYEIIGTIAGDDTILLIPRDGFPRQELVKVLKTKIPFLNQEGGT